MYLHVLRHVVHTPAFSRISPFLARTYTTKVSKPLRILFCGSDYFSIASLRALHEEHERDPESIQSIDVLCRPGKPAGRSLKELRDVPIKAVAQELGLRIHERDTFTGWELPRTPDGPFNLIIAVSFGLFVPPRILNSVEYGGLNVHPSLLPNLRGPAPLHHTIMKGITTTGVTLQTLDEKSFDHGVILAQTPPTGLKVPEFAPGKSTFQDLFDFVTPKAAELLVQGIRDKVFVPPLQNVGWYHCKTPIHAHKITSADRQIDWAIMPPGSIERRYNALGRLWNRVYAGFPAIKRISFEDVEVVPTPPVLAEFLNKFTLKPQNKQERPNLIHSNIHPEIRFMVYCIGDDKRYPQIYIEDGDAIIISSLLVRELSIRVKEITVEGQSKTAARQAMQQFDTREIWELKKAPKDRLRVQLTGTTRLRIRKYKAAPGPDMAKPDRGNFRKIKVPPILVRKVAIGSEAPSGDV